MELLCGIFLAILGGTMLIKPKAIWIISDSWKIKSNAEPTDLYIILIRIGGCILVVGGIFAIFQI